MRLIDADAMTADLLTVDPQYETMIHWCLTVLDAQQTVDAVEVIRCKDCKHNPEEEWFGCHMVSSHKRGDDDYCSYAERRQDG